MGRRGQGKKRRRCRDGELVVEASGDGDRQRLGWLVVTWKARDFSSWYFLIFDIFLKKYIIWLPRRTSAPHQIKLVWTSEQRLTFVCVEVDNGSKCATSSFEN